MKAGTARIWFTFGGSYYDQIAGDVRGEQLEAQKTNHIYRARHRTEQSGKAALNRAISPS
jgi:hypothetical protein